MRRPPSIDEGGVSRPVNSYWRFSSGLPGFTPISGPESTVFRPLICPKPTRGRTIQNWLPSRAMPSPDFVRRMRTSAFFSSLERLSPVTSPTCTPW